MSQTNYQSALFVDDQPPQVDVSFFNITDVLLHQRSENECLQAFYNLSKRPSDIPPVAVNVIICTLCEMIPNWSHKVIVASAPLLLSLITLFELSEKHARMLTACIGTLFHAVIHGKNAKPGDIAGFAKYGDILARTLSMCLWDEEDRDAMLSIADDIANSPEVGDRLMATRIFQGLALSRNARVLSKKALIPRLQSILEVGENEIIGDVVFAYACAMRTMTRRAKMDDIWLGIRTIWYDSGVDEAVDRRAAVASLCQAFRSDADVYHLFTDKGQRVAEFLLDVCKFTAEEVAGLEPRDGNSRLEYLACVAEEMGELAKFMAASGNAEVKKEGKAMFEDLCNHKEAAVRKGCAGSCAAVYQLLGNAEKKKNPRRGIGCAPSGKRRRCKVKMPASIVKLMGKIKFPSFLRRKRR